MFTKTLFGKTKDVLALLGKSHILDKAYLAGGSGLSLQLGHRISVDLDFFTPEEFEPKEIVSRLQKLGNFKLDQTSWGTVLGRLEDIRFSFFVYKYPVLFPFRSLYEINILDLRDIAAMKLDAIATRGTRRDFIDLYFICQKGILLKKIFSFYDRKFGKLASNIVHIQKSLVYFVDAESEKMPRTLKSITWGEIKKYFEEEVRKIAKSGESV